MLLWFNKKYPKSQVNSKRLLKVVYEAPTLEETMQKAT